MNINFQNSAAIYQGSDDASATVDFSQEHLDFLSNKLNMKIIGAKRLGVSVCLCAWWSVGSVGGRWCW